MPALKMQKAVRADEGRTAFFCDNLNFIIAQEMTKLRLTMMQFTGIL